MGTRVSNFDEQLQPGENGVAKDRLV